MRPGTADLDGGTFPGLCAQGVAEGDPNQCLCQWCGLWRHRFLKALHDEPDHLCFAGAAVSIATSERRDWQIFTSRSSRLAVV